MSLTMSSSMEPQDKLPTLTLPQKATVRSVEVPTASKATKEEPYRTVQC